MISILLNTCTILNEHNYYYLLKKFRELQLPSACFVYFFPNLIISIVESYTQVDKLLQTLIRAQRFVRISIQTAVRNLEVGLLPQPTTGKLRFMTTPVQRSCKQQPIKFIVYDPILYYLLCLVFIAPIILLLVCDQLT